MYQNIKIKPSQGPNITNVKYLRIIINSLILLLNNENWRPPFLLVII